MNIFYSFFSYRAKLRGAKVSFARFRHPILSLFCCFALRCVNCLVESKWNEIKYRLQESIWAETEVKSTFEMNCVCWLCACVCVLHQIPFQMNWFFNWISICAHNRIQYLLKVWHLTIYSYVQQRKRLVIFPLSLSFHVFIYHKCVIWKGYFLLVRA